MLPERSSPCSQGPAIGGDIEVKHRNVVRFVGQKSKPWMTSN